MKTLTEHSRLSRQQTPFVALLMMFVFISGCNKDHYPKDWQPAVIAPSGQCPDITGTYKIEYDSVYVPEGFIGSRHTDGEFVISHSVAYHALAGRYFHEEIESAWDVMTISGNPQELLQVTLYQRGGDTEIKKAIELKKSGGDYRCNEGWLQSSWPKGTPMRDADDTDWRGLNKTLNFAKNHAGELVVRTDIQRWYEFSVWCGDGCKYVRIPFTSETSYAWSRLDSAQIPILEPVSPLPVAKNPDADVAAGESPTNRVMRILRAMTPDGVRIVSLHADSERWIARFHGGTDNLIALHEKLMSSEALSDVTAKTAEPHLAEEKDMEFNFVAVIKEEDAKLLLETRELVRKLGN